MIGYVDHIGMNRIVGWARAPLDVSAPPTVAAMFRGQIIGQAKASLPRPDVAQAINGNPNCGFVIDIDPPYDVDEIVVEADGWGLPVSEPLNGNLSAGLAGHLYHLAPKINGLVLRVTEPRTTHRDLDICARLIAAYRPLLSQADATFAGSNSMWTWLLDKNFRNLSQIVARGDTRELCEYLLLIHKRPESWGICQGPESYHLLKNSGSASEAHRSHAALYCGELLSLAEFLGLLPVENLGQGRVHDTVDLAALVVKIRSRIGIDPIFPHMAGALFCLDTGAGLVHQRDVWALYAALRITNLLQDRPTKRICEIGGGLGQLCVYARALGAEKYTLIDLPPVSLLQAFQLMRAHPDARIALYDGGDFDTDADICIYPTFMYERAPDTFFDLTVNVDSMPEMGWHNAVSYAQAAARKSRLFLSINQEAQATLGIGEQRQINVADVFAHVKDWRQAYRFRSWVRRGYVESLYTAAGASPDSGHGASTVAAQREYEGYLDTVGPNLIAGWARNMQEGEPVTVDIAVDGQVVATTAANGFSPALEQAGIGSGRHVFAIRAPLQLFDGCQHLVSARFARTGIDLQRSPRSVQMPSILGYGRLIEQALPAEPWIIDGVDLVGTELMLRGWAIPPRDSPDEAGFLINNVSFDLVDWPQPRSDIHHLYFFHPHAGRSGFLLRADISSFLQDGADELVLRYVRTAASINPNHDYYFPIRRDSAVPLPEPFRMKRVTGSEDPLLFELGGYTLLRKIEHLLADRGAPLDKQEAILDWGCGCGRLLRFLAGRNIGAGRVLGADIDADNIAWCREHLGASSAELIPLMPPTAFASGRFSLITGNSVFTHLGEAAQHAWLAELRRIARPGALILVTIQTIADLTRETFDPAAFERLLRRGFLSESLDDALHGVIGDGQYYRSAFHTHEYVRSVWSEYFDIEEILPQFSNNMQDLVVMRKR